MAIGTTLVDLDPSTFTNVGNGPTLIQNNSNKAVALIIADKAPPDDADVYFSLPASSMPLYVPAGTLYVQGTGNVTIVISA